MEMINWGKDSKEDEGITVKLPLEDKDKVNLVLKHFPLEFANGTHFVRIAIDRLYEIKKAEFLKKKAEIPPPPSIPPVPVAPVQNNPTAVFDKVVTDAAGGFSYPPVGQGSKGMNNQSSGGNGWS